MKQLLCFLGVLCCVTSAATAGPNVGGVLWVHNTGMVMSSDGVPASLVQPTDCTNVDNQMPLLPPPAPATVPDAEKRIWKVYAAFPAGSSPRLVGLGWGIQFPNNVVSPYSYINTLGGQLPNENVVADLQVAASGFPTASGGELGMSFGGGARTTNVITVYTFWGFGYNSGASTDPALVWQLVQHSGPNNRFFIDDASPENWDAIAGYGSLGFGVPGMNQCPTSDPDAACCALDGTCTITKQAACTAPSIWHGVVIVEGDVTTPISYTCTPNPCPQPTGACCWNDYRPCQITSEAQCATGGSYQGDFVLCAPNPCPAAAACCMPSGTCFVRTEAACATLNPPGTWRPESSSCTPNPCPSLPTGSCCLPDGSCTVTTETACTASWTLSGTCVVNICPAPEAPGACCTLSRLCTLTLQGACEQPSQWHAEWSSCDPNSCLTLQGACCALDGACTLTAVSDCGPSLTWRGDLTSCDPNLCPLLPTESTSWGQIKNRYR